MIRRDEIVPADYVFRNKRITESRKDIEMAELEKDMTNRELGKQLHTCRICGETGEFDTYLAREMMQGSKEEFVYFVCEHCQCLQIAEVPENIGDYYGSGYYSFQVPESPNVEFDTPITHMMKVLDVGCGAGAWLVKKAFDGWGNLYGCDPFLEHDRHYGSRVSIRNCSIHEVEGDGTFDVIRMSDSFEHMTDPLEVLKSARRLLKPGGTLYMTIPTYPNVAFEHFGPHWYQLDAPRHIFLHSRQSLEWLSKESGLAISGVRYNSNNNQIIRSYFYQHGISYFEQTPELVRTCFNNEDINSLQAQSESWNEEERGDHMKVYWQKNEAFAKGNTNKVIYQRFSPKDRGLHFPYPPVYRQPDTDYICFTDNATVTSNYWDVRVVENLEEADLEVYLKAYAVRWELGAEQIQMGPLSEAFSSENVVNVLSFDEMPLVHFDLEKFVPTADKNGKYVYRKNPVYQKGKYNGRPFVLTIGVPVSNQIDTIDRCLSHIKPLLQRLDAELLVIDTGSTDGTVEVCKSYGARVISHPWCDNMSAVRNEGIYHARGEWYMSIDDDEWFEDVEDIIKFFSQGTYRHYNCATYIQRNYMDSEGKVYEDFHTPRMARITPELHFEGRIHDALDINGNVKSYMLKSYAHHYGFVHDRKEKVQEKFMRNASILLYDIYEYPENLRYLFQLANEYRIIQDKVVAVKLFAQIIALSMVAGNTRRGKLSVVELLTCLYDTDDRRLFRWSQHLENLFPLNVVEQAALAWCKECMAFHMGKSAEQVLEYYHQYRDLLEKYHNDSGIGQWGVFHGLAMVEHDAYIMEADAIAFCSYLKLKEEEKALEILPRVSLETVSNRRIAVLIGGLIAGEEVFNALIRKITALQWEEWSEEILDAFVTNLVKDYVYNQQLERLSILLSKISVSAIISWVEQQYRKNQNTVAGKRLLQYAMEYIPDYSSVQVLCLCAFVLKEAYVKRREEEGGKEILYRYIEMMGAFVARYYSPELITDPFCYAVAPDMRAIYMMSVVLSNGKASHENVAILKVALEIFPSFHEEIRNILMSLE